MEHELKFVTPALRAPIVLQWLRSRCVPDRDHPEGRVTSVYFDNRALSRLSAKLNSDFLKEKVRVRWYSTGQGPTFVEIKRKVGSRRQKARIALPEATARNFHDRRPGCHQQLLGVLRDSGEWVDTDIQPFLSIGFQRHRFIEPLSRLRVSIDSDIRASSVNSGMLPLRHPAPLAHAVVEIKGTDADVPPRLSSLRNMGCWRQSFSKYARCYQKISRLSSF